MKKIILVFYYCFCFKGNAQIITTVAGNGTLGYSGDGGQATIAEFYAPSKVILDAAGNLYIADLGNNRIRKISLSGIINTIAGTGTAGYSGDGGQATVAELNQASGVCFDAAGNLYIADQVNNRVRLVNATGIISTFAGTGMAGYSGDGGEATSAELYTADDIIYDSDGNLYISDTNNERIRKVNTAGVISTIVGNGTAGFSGDGGQATAAELHRPTGLVYDAVGNLYIADELNNRIRMVNTAGIISTIVGNGVHAFSGDGGAATLAELSYPNGVCLDPAGNIYISDSGNNRIRRVNTTGIISTIVGIGTAGYSGDGGSSTAAEIHGPARVILDSVGNLYFCDNGNSSVRMVTNIGQMSVEQFGIRNFKFSIYPNPAKDILNVECLIINEKTTLVITDMLGNTVKQIPFTTQHLTFNITDLTEGVFNISLQSNEGVINKRVVIVR
jgi:sugar lactone lactonase YvrE